MHALSLADPSGHGRFLPAEAVYPHSAFGSGAFEKYNAGVGVGFSFHEACRDGVFSLFAHELLKAVAVGKALLTGVDLGLLSRASPDIEYLHRSFEHLAQPIQLLASGPEYGGHCVLARLRNDAADLWQAAVGAADSLERAAVTAMTELLAITLGGTSSRTVEYYLPRSLGYVLPFSGAAISREPCLTPKAAEQIPVCLLHVGGKAYSDILVSNLITPDLASCGIFAVKTFFVRTVQSCAASS
jgi:hypothetical protein